MELTEIQSKQKWDELSDELEKMSIQRKSITELPRNSKTRNELYLKHYFKDDFTDVLHGLWLTLTFRSLPGVRRIRFYNTKSYLKYIIPELLITDKEYREQQLRKFQEEIRKLEQIRGKRDDVEHFNEQITVRKDIINLISKYNELHTSNIPPIAVDEKVVIKCASSKAEVISKFCYEIEIISKQDEPILRSFFENTIDFKSDMKIQINKPNHLIAHLFSQLDKAEGREYGSRENYHIKAAHAKLFISFNLSQEGNPEIMTTKHWNGARNARGSSVKAEKEKIEEFIKNLTN